MNGSNLYKGVNLILLIGIIVLAIILLTRKPVEPNYDEIYQRIEELNRNNIEQLEQIAFRDQNQERLLEEFERLNQKIDQLENELQDINEQRDSLLARLDGLNIQQRYEFFTGFDSLGRLRPHIFVIEE